jgi:predicted nucleic acid-binding protein
MPKGVLLDTSFFLRFLKEDDPLFKNADDYFRYFLKEEYSLYVSTVTIAEFCVGGSPDEMPLKNLRILPFNYNHAVRTGHFARCLFEARRNKTVIIKERLLIPNDAKLFAQADTEAGIEHFVTSDAESLKAYAVLKQYAKPLFSTIDLNIPYTETFGILDL